jgi:protease-4
VRSLFKRKWFWVLLVVVGFSVASRMWSRGPNIPPGSFLVIDLEGEYAEGPPRPLLAALLQDGKSYVDLVETLEKARRDARLSGVIFRIGPLAAGWGQAREIRDSIRLLREAGKKVVAYLDNEAGSGNLAYYLASSADSIYIPPGGTSMLNGLSANFVFLGGLWEKLDVAMEVQQLREFKTFGDMISRRDMSAAHREMANSLLDDLNDEFLAGIADGRRQAVTEVMATIDSCPTSAGEYVEANLADRIAFFDEMLAELGGGLRVHAVRDRDYRRVAPETLGLGGSGEKVAIIHAVGNIVGGDQPRGGALGSTIGSRTLSRAFRQAIEDDSVKAIVFRVDSPGGSAMASDQVWHALRLAREKKPVIASLGNVAASGGYYMASGADKIYAESGTLTGSIGVVMLKPNLAGLLTRTGIGSETLGRGRYSRVMDVTKAMDKTEVALIQTQMAGVYRRFLDRVAESRGKTVEEVDALGGGRVWTGRQAKQRGLIDEIGGLADAIRAAAEQGGIKEPDRLDVVHFPEAESPLQEVLASYRSEALAGVLAMVPELKLDFLARHLGIYAAFDPGVYAIPGALVDVR